MPFTELENWNCAISYGVGSTSPLSPSFIFSLELARSTQVCFNFTCISVRKRLHFISLKLLRSFDKAINYVLPLSNGVKDIFCMDQYINLLGA